VPGGQVWYQVFGARDAIPILLLHGGPGAGHDYLEPLAALASDWPVVFYDQLGCGRSDQPDDASLWTVDRAVAEVDDVRAGLGLDRIHLFGQSWGGWLAIEYMARQPSGILSLILASTSASIPQFVREAERLKDTLPAGTGDILRRYEATEDYDNPAYQDALLVFYRENVCRLDPWPDCVLRTVANLEGNQVYAVMNGPNEFTVIGRLKDWDRTAALGTITVPTLITVGRYDELTPACAETLRAGIPNAQLHLFENSAHLAHVEETESYLRVVREFLNQVEHGA
jgi:proline-specific peptidase